VWRLTGMDDAGRATIAGAAFDPTSGRLYITERYGEDPVVHVYQVTVQGPSLEPALYLPVVRGLSQP